MKHILNRTEIQSTRSSNINSSTGKREFKNKIYTTALEFYFNDNVIYAIVNNNTQISEGELGSMNFLNQDGFLYIAKDSKDFKRVLDNLKSNKLSDDFLSDIVFENFEEKFYNRDNNFPLQFRINCDNKKIENALKVDSCIVLDVTYCDDYVDDEGYHLYLNEDLPQTIFLTLEEFNKVINNEAEKVDILWKKLRIKEIYDIEDRFGKNILEDGGFSNIVKDALRRIYAIGEHSTIQSNLDTLVLSLDKEKLAEELKLKEDLKHKLPKRINITRKDLVESKEGELLLEKLDSMNKDSESQCLLLLNEIHQQYFGKSKAKLSYKEFIKYIVKKLCTKDVMDFDYGVRSLKVLYQEIGKNSVKNETSDIYDNYKLLAKDLNINPELFAPIFKQPLRTVLQIIQNLL